MTAVLSQTITFLKNLCRYKFKILPSYFEQSVHKYSTQSSLLQSYFEFRLFFLRANSNDGNTYYSLCKNFSKFYRNDK